MIGENEKGKTWIVEVSLEEMQTLAPTFDQNWRVSYVESMRKLNLDTRQRNALRRGAYKPFTDMRFSQCFKKDGMVLSFEEWCRQENLRSRLKALDGIGPAVARQIEMAIEKYVADNPNEYMPREAIKMTEAIDPIALRNKAVRILEGKSDKENRILDSNSKMEIIGGPHHFTVTNIPRDLAVEIVYQFLLKKENERIEWEAKQWRGD